MYKKALSIILVIAMVMVTMPLNIFAATDSQAPKIDFSIAEQDGVKLGSANLMNSIVKIQADDKSTGGSGIKSLTIQWNDGQKEVWEGYATAYTKVRTGVLKAVATDYAGNTSIEYKVQFTTNGIWKSFSDNTKPVVSVNLDSGAYEMYKPDGSLYQIKVTATDKDSKIAHITYAFEQLGSDTVYIPEGKRDYSNAIVYNFPNKAGKYRMHVYAADESFNYSEVVTREYTLVDNTGGSDQKVEDPDYPANPNFKGFGAWLRATKRFGGSDFVLNNHVANGTTVEYIVEYYNNGKASNGYFDINLKIPNDAKFVSGTCNAKATNVNGELIITWRINNVPEGGKGKVRTTVTYGADVSANPTKDIYPVMTAVAGSSELARSGLKHLYINPNSYASAAHNAIAVGDNYGYLNADMNITRAEFAQVLYNAGLIRTNANINSYKRYSDAYLFDDPRISYCKQAVSALIEDGLAIGDNYGRYNPFQAITYGEIQTIVAKIIAQGKEVYGIKVDQTPLFILQQGLQGWWDSYETELVRLNINESTPSNSTSYISRREMLKQLNRALMRGPVVESHLTVPKVKDLPRSDRDYLDLVEATVSHYTGYDNNLKEVWR